MIGQGVVLNLATLMVCVGCDGVFTFGPDRCPRCTDRSVWPFVRWLDARREGRAP